MIPEWLQNYATSSSIHEPSLIPVRNSFFFKNRNKIFSYLIFFIFKWNNFNLEQLNLTDIMLQRIFNIECEQIILKYENYRNLLNSRLVELNLNNSKNISHI